MTVDVPRVASRELTFLFTDIEGSTSKWEEQPESMALAVGEHDALMRDIVQRHGGRIVKTTGDGIYAAFETPDEGLRAVVTIQLALLDPAATAGLALRVRCGLHTGPVQARDDDYFGGTINRTARIMGAAHGGQILVSKAVADQLRGPLAGDVALKDLGAVRLKGLATSEVVFQVLHPRLFQDFPALRELEATPNNLPQQLTSFVGRERERVEVEEMLAAARLLTLVGMGGLGKTRLALQIASAVIDGYPDGAWFIDLQTIRDPSLVAPETARVLGVREEPGRPLLQTLCAHLKSRKLLLILDNCEQVVDAVAVVAHTILERAANVRIVATSRVALRVPGEQTYVLQPLPVPASTSDVEALLRSTAVQLFVERARLHKPSFTLTEREASAVAELVSRLEGIPLALELAAARVRSLAVVDINKRLDHRYKLLTGGDRTLQARQQTLRALVDWSFDLLDGNEQILLARLSVFAGSFDFEAAEAVCGTDPLHADDVLDLVTSLVEKSLVNIEEVEDATRYRMLETLRDYGREKLALRAEQGTLAEGHCRYFLTVAKASNQGLQGPEQAQWIDRTETVLDDLRAAMGLTLARGVDPVIGVKYAVALLGFWMLRGYATEARTLVRALLECDEVRALDVAHAHALYVGAGLADVQGDHVEARRMLEACLALRRSLGKDVEVAATLSTLSLVRLHAGDIDHALDDETEALALFRGIEDRVGEAICLLHLGEIRAYVGDDAAARNHFVDCLGIAKAVGHQEVQAEAEINLGELALAAGDSAAAFQHCGRALALCRDAKDRRGEAIAHWWVGRCELASGRPGAPVRLAHALASFQRFEMQEELLGCLDDVAHTLQASSDTNDAVSLQAAVDAARERLALARSPREARRHAARVAVLRDAAGDAFAEHYARGAARELEAAVSQAKAALEREPPAR